MNDPEVIKWLVIGVFGFLTVLVVAIAAKNGWFHSISAGVGKGISITAKEKKNKEEEERAREEEKARQEEKEFQSGCLNNKMDADINRLDVKLADFALETAKNLRRSLNIELSMQIRCSSTRRALASCLRYPLLDAARRNNFCVKLRPENIKEYVESLMKEVVLEYQEFSAEKETSHCSNNPDLKCASLPPLGDTLVMLQKKVTEEWAVLVRGKNIEICEEKKAVYDEYKGSFEKLGNNVLVKVCVYCKGKNEDHITALSRKPDREKGEF
jgi:hypothetical protein